ncbi:MAG: phosphodiesterase [Beijerinckiaceae bacterium]|jgi:3',5'-cyclic AMP phosphodiesterase CpdA|nr:phosphodiesterase [Beijerinckiaceae bacterium]
MKEPNPVLVAQITDLHIKAPGERAYGRVDTASALERLVLCLNGLRPRPDLVVISGDLVDGGSAAEYAHLKERLAELHLPFALTAGNHDERRAARAAFADQPFVPGEALNQHRRVGPLDIILLDSSVPGQSHGHLDAATLAWLEGVLDAPDAGPALLFMHHPPFRPGIWHMDRQGLRNADDLAAIVLRHPHVQLVAAGHVHRAITTRFAGTAASICPAPSHAVALDLDASLVPSFSFEPPAFHLHAWNPGEALLTTHLVPVGTFDGPHPFFSSEGRLL